MTRMVKHLPTMRETGVQSLGREDPLEKEMATHSSTLAWKIPWMEEPGGPTVHGVAKTQIQLSDFTFTLTAPLLLTYENNSGGFSSSYRTIVLEIPQF